MVYDLVRVLYSHELVLFVEIIWILHTFGDAVLHDILKQSIKENMCTGAIEKYVTPSLVCEPLATPFQNDESMFHENRCGKIPNEQENSFI